jgi:hypothetical protein
LESDIDMKRDNIVYETETTKIAIVAALTLIT